MQQKMFSEGDSVLFEFSIAAQLAGAIKIKSFSMVISYIPKTFQYGAFEAYLRP